MLRRRGYIGSVVSEVLLNSGHDVVVFDSFETGHRAAVDPRAALIVGDTCDAGGVREAMLSAAPDVVVHMAAYIQMGESMLDPGKYFRNNTANTLNVLDAMLAASVSHFVFSSTAGIYGTPESLPIEEDHPIDPLNPYSESKRQVESTLRWYAQAHGIAATIFRFFNAAGATVNFGEDHRPESHLIPIVLPSGAGQARAPRSLRHRLRHPRRHSEPRLYSRARSRAGAFAGDTEDGFPLSRE